MESPEWLKEQLSSSITGLTGLAAANRLCEACGELLDITGAAISLVVGGQTQGTFGSSGPLSKALDEYQFTFGEGPSLDTARCGRPVLAPDLNAEDEQRWPVFSQQAVKEGVRAIFALPIFVAPTAIGALDLFRKEAGPLTKRDLAGGLWAAELAAKPVLDCVAEIEHADSSSPVEHGHATAPLADLDRLEVYQATGFLISQLNVDPAEALVRLRAHAFANDLTASEVAASIVQRRLFLDHEGGRMDSNGDGGTL